MMRLGESEIWQHLDRLTKPPRSLGQLEKLAVRLCAIQQSLSPQTQPRRLVLFAADHGVVAEGVSAWPAEVTGQMIDNIRRGGAASSVLARTTETQLRLVDVGSLAETGGSVEGVESQEGSLAFSYRNARIRGGSHNLFREPAVRPEEFARALQIGREEARRARDEGVVVVACGEMGIGNTTSAACLTMLLAGVPLDEAVGRGAGADETVLARKREVVRQAMARIGGGADSLGSAAVQAVAGLEIVAIAGCFLAAREAGMTIVLDGYVTTAAALIAETLEPGCAESMIASHLSAEPGHRRALEFLKLSPALDWELRLGEGTGSLLVMPLLDAAASISAQMRTFADLGISSEDSV